MASCIATDLVHWLILNVALTVSQENKDRRSMNPVSFDVSCFDIADVHTFLYSNMIP